MKNISLNADALGNACGNVAKKATGVAICSFAVGLFCKWVADKFRK